MQIWKCRFCGKEFGIDKEGDPEYLKSVVAHMMNHAKDPEYIQRFFKIEEEKRRQDSYKDN
ncbi:MAG: hypothetical protein COX90_02170 [Candidatus Nealsonbacteria bacterium CG_4_10_14_0_2_um_filter_38_17]|uniref:DUF1059 domain-containing protein n=2 Tax=Candidatus Nealsoniibacteriota TaxID=1817911 RepID=A0A2M7UY46_9BACT|nr:MAG: hypothetical protein COX36_04165 [Candidatus Nealsonbacteria bacterium CG23_combo_of_CG06-09_8_20_14_all_38_19]PIZ88889.1 MAG: hypothetical protein COX90_02170 [Candidatus Nealsonbacteria bacterium CG_4_10_14_0_2_um_filter_38_17]